LCRAIYGSLAIKWDGSPSIKLIISRRARTLPILIFQRLRNRAALAPLSNDELQESETLCGARVPMRMDRAGSNEQAVSGVQCYWRLLVLLPDSGTGQDMERDRYRMEVSRIDFARRILCIPNNYLLAM